MRASLGPLGSAIRDCGTVLFHPALHRLPAHCAYLDRLIVPSEPTLPYPVRCRVPLARRFLCRSTCPSCGWSGLPADFHSAFAHCGGGALIDSTDGSQQAASLLCPDSRIFLVLPEGEAPYCPARTTSIRSAGAFHQRTGPHAAMHHADASFRIEPSGGLGLLRCHARTQSPSTAVRFRQSHPGSSLVGSYGCSRWFPRLSQGTPDQTGHSPSGCRQFPIRGGQAGAPGACR